MWPDAGTPYLDMYTSDYYRTVRRVCNKRDATVVHQETCPCCGRKLVNLYLGDVKKVVEMYGEKVVKTEKEWKCKTCWDKEKGE